jgi:hypothetical protein
VDGHVGMWEEWGGGRGVAGKKLDVVCLLW